MSLRSFKPRSFYPVLPVLILAIVSHIGYYGGSRLENDSLHHLAAILFGPLYFVAVALGPGYVFTRMSVEGANLAQRIVASFFVPFVWMTKEVLLLTDSFPISQALYFYFSPIHFWLILFSIFQMGIATLIARLILKMKGDDLSIITRPPLFVIAGSLASVISLYAWGKGENIYVIYLAFYRVLFGSGI